MRKIFLILILIFFLNINFSPFSEQEDILKKADLLLDMMEYESAINYYKKILLKNPNIRDIRKKIGYAYFQLKKVNEALKYLEQELIVFPDNEDAYDLLVYILYKLNRVEEARGLFPAVFSNFIVMKLH